MKRFYIIIFILLIALNVPSTGDGAVQNSDQQRYLSAHVLFNEDLETTILLGYWNEIASVEIDHDNYASAWQISNIEYSFLNTSLTVDAQGETSKKGVSAEAASRLRADFSILNDPMVWNIDYTLTGGGHITLYDGWNWTTPLESFSSGTGLDSGTLAPGEYRLWVSAGEVDIGSFDMTFTISEVPVPSAVWLLGSGLIGLIGLRKELKK
jgi:hypothetical protein